MGDLVRDAPEDEPLHAAHPPVPDDDQVRLLRLCNVEQGIRWVSGDAGGVDLKPVGGQTLR